MQHFDRLSVTKVIFKEEKMINKKTIFIVQMLLVFIATVIVSKPLSEIIVWKMNDIRDRKYRWESINKKKDLNPVAWMEIPEIKLSTFVMADPTEKNLSEYPCLADFSAIQTKGMNIVLGHRDMRFFKLRNLEYDHPIKLEFSDKTTREFKICEMEVLPKDQAEKRLAEKKDENWLVLMTCHPFLFVGPAPDRFLVWAKEVDS